MAEPHSILHVISARHYMGESARVIELTTAQLAAGHRVKIVARRGGAVEEEATKRGLPCMSLTMNSRFNPVTDLRDIWALRREITEAGVTVVHCHRGKDHWLSAAAVALSTPRPILIRTRHVILALKRHLANRWLWGSFTDGIVCVSSAVKESLQASLEGIPVRAPLQTIEGGTDLNALKAKAESVTALRQELTIPDGAPVVTLLARISFVKGQRFFARAIPEILKQHPSVIFVFAYSREVIHYRRDLEAEIDALGCRSSIRFTGMLNNVGDLLSLTTVGVIASIGSEGWSRAAVEYMASGVPIVATTVGSLPGMIDEGKTGLLVPPEEPEALAAATNTLLAYSELHQRIAAAGLVQAENYTRKRMSEEVLEFYHSLTR